MFGPLFQYGKMNNYRSYSLRTNFLSTLGFLIDRLASHLSLSHPNHVRNLTMIRRDNWLISTKFFEMKLASVGRMRVCILCQWRYPRSFRFACLHSWCVEWSSRNSLATIIFYCVWSDSIEFASLCVFISAVSAINECIYRRTMVRIRQKLAEIHLRSNEETKRCAKQCSKNKKKNEEKTTISRYKHN